MLRPSPLMLGVLAGWFGLGVLASVWEWALLPFWIYLVVFLVVASLQALVLLRIPVPDVSRELLHSFAVGTWGNAALRIESHASRDVRLRVHDHHPVEMEVHGVPWDLTLPAGEVVELKYRIRPIVRGELQFAPAQLLMSWPTCLWHRNLRAGEATKVKVYPDYRPVMNHALMAAEDQVRQMGIRRRRQRGGGMDFHQLREFREGDMIRQIDWKATSRRQQLISREYQEERDQKVLFVLDCGRRMHARESELSHFDHALNAVLLLSYVALRQGDAVGMLTFSGQDRWLPPVKGANGMTTVLNHIYDLQTTLQPSDYLEAAQRVMRSMPRRALVVFVTNLREEDQDELRPALQMLEKRHLVLVASLREAVIDHLHSTDVDGLEDALLFAAAHQFHSDRQQVHESVRSFGARVLDVKPEDLPGALVGRYFDIKRSGAL